ncbi:hypothetical protein RM553_12830 [Zunongwangia sp. F363]|uniref:Uncharacterized protein n=1 Tax=Autumnicola tepida TaxID=3075595 RepID=A0ABU3CCG2_9FLAO|nr:hypothetical protein [Zunongwangia sp. F363]MDT0643720.1 hypothetical protein [Zunongwangia sp. F363]
MISAKDREELLSVLPKEYGKSVAIRLNGKGLLSQRGKKYDSPLVRKVLGGNQEDINVELELFLFKDEILTKREELKKLRKKKYEPEPLKGSIPKTQ